MTIKTNGNSELLKTLIFLCQNFDFNLSPAELLIDISIKRTAILAYGQISEIEIEYKNEMAEITFVLKDSRLSYIPLSKGYIKYNVRIKWIWQQKRLSRIKC